jgi:hypothetical protein
MVMKPTVIVAACVAAAAISLAAFASASYGNGSTEPQHVSPALEVFTEQGIPLARARQAYRLQQQVAATHLAARVEAALGADFAGVWFEPAAVRFHIGVTSSPSA